MSDDDEWYSSGDDGNLDGLLDLLADKTPVERLREEVQEQRVATTSAYRRVEELNTQVQAATAEFQRQQQLLHSKQKELAAAQQAAALSPEQQYYAKLNELRGNQDYYEWLHDTRITQQQRKELHALYTKCVRTLHKRMPVFGKYLGEK